ncbi:pyridoxal phosphate phosphatase PHOSPHO2-like isoform X2 [Toxorhynchites rutilus septentrionalis]|uniref:pyridoxal phosphate phosphatase PHOSPHO2-like isoform X2 n=1 Tax=Toxorhynchites rutilus septentrionalis TaxID=329112 RepID=UPI00247AE0CA|nr:pyridoxal phosphate phosphatase PHOSPHO2-like isoform X2 [Toxorhynchites rutilus septentrionalis]
MINSMISPDGHLLKNLAVFDFDHTICEYNTDIVVRNLLDQRLITPEIRNILKTCGWIPYMQRILRMLYLSGVSASDIVTAIRSIPEVPGMKSCIEMLATNNFHVIIISDSNSEFIKIWNDFNDIGRYIHSTFTNPAKFNSNGLLEVHPFHHQKECTLSSRNLCKGKILEHFLNKQYNETNIEYEKIFYIGDGKNDVCPMLCLKENGYACPREGYRCYDELVNVIIERSITFDAKILKWNTGSHLECLVRRELEML